ncbi:hypothetical protein PUN4_780010 [Paraburkholderia unamae]|nr:hypothetical protein PUN4_780010 [Paraburkholderia unamae]
MWRFVRWGFRAALGCGAPRMPLSRSGGGVAKKLNNEASPGEAAMPEISERHGAAPRRKGA